MNIPLFQNFTGSILGVSSDAKLQHRFIGLFRVLKKLHAPGTPAHEYRQNAGNVKSMSQGKLEVVKQELARVNIDIPGISKLKWTGMGEFNSDDHHIYYCGKESLEEME